MIRNMTNNKHVVNQVDKGRLERYLEGNIAPPAHRLRRLLDAARAVGPDRVPADVVTMNSHIRIRDHRSDTLESFILAYPDQEDSGEFTVSVLSPLGAALLATREGEEVTFPGARSMRSVFIESLVYQPERAGDHDL